MVLELFLALAFLVGVIIGRLTVSSPKAPAHPVLLGPSAFPALDGKEPVAHRRRAGDAYHD